MSSRISNLYISAVVALGAASLTHGIWMWHSGDWKRYLYYCAIALIASGMKVSLPSVSGTMSMNFVFVMLGVAQLSLGETLAMGSLGMLVQSVFRTKNRPRPVQVVFSVASVACSIWVSYSVFHARVFESGFLATPVLLLLAAGAYFVVNTLSVATVIGLTESKNAWFVWRESYFWSFPNYLVGAEVAWLVDAATKYFGWQATLLLLPVVYVIYRSHTLYVSRIEEARKRAEEQRAHAEEVASLHRRTVETLALAIEAKDQTTADHLERVEVYAIEVAKELGLSNSELEALRAAALLHDIGKVAVPEYIISKPGRLTPEEFEKMKTHTIVGAEIVEQIRFPYPVAPIVRSHHERWNGTGYPDGLSGENIPIGARIISAVDCLDALASDRQYRRALPLAEAIKVVQDESGKSFDPRVVDVLARRYVELEQMAKSGKHADKAKLSTDLKIERGDAPAAGFENTNADLVNFHNSLSAADARGRLIEEFSSKAKSAGDLQTVFTHLQKSLRIVVPYALMAVYLRREDVLVPENLDGDEYKLFSMLEIPLGMGLSGWVAENNKPILNGNPSVEPGYLSDPSKFSNLRSALAVPLEASGGVIGVLSLYRHERDAFNKGNLETLNAFGAPLASALRRLARVESKISG